MTGPPARATTWWVAGLLAISATTMRDPLPRASAIAFCLAIALLVGRAMWTADRTGAHSPRALATASILAWSATVAATPIITGLVPMPAEPRLLVGAAAMQVVLLVLGRDPAPLDAGRWSRLILPAVGHLAAACGAYLLLLHGPAGLHVAILAFAGGFSILALHVFWNQRLARRAAGRETLEGWEGVLLVAILLSLLAAADFYLGLVGIVPIDPGFAMPLFALAGFTAALVLADPPPAPEAFRLRTGGVSTMLAHGAAGLALLNVLFVLFAIVATGSARVAIVLLTAYLVLAVAMEYRSVKRALAARRALHPPPTKGPLGPVTVVVPARDEEATLRASMEQNLALPPQATFLLLPSAASRDGTVEAANAIAAAHPDRVRVLVGAGATKAEDLAHAWPFVDTEAALLLDADETLDEGALRQGLAILAATPDAGVVQGRKVSRDPEGSTLARFVSVERRHSTGLDQPMHAELGSAHFAGSAALLRKSAVEDAGGWASETLTEDIELTLRLHLRTEWRIVYAAAMVIREADPIDLRALVRQRTRWARGWTQCFVRYFGEILARRRQLGARRTFGLAYLMAMAVSAPLMALFPAMLFLRTLGVPSLLPFAIALAVAAVVLPARIVGYGASALVDPQIPVPRRPLRFAEHFLHAYAWIVFGWFVHLHALYQELSSAPRVWYVTRKRAARAVLPTRNAAGVGP